MTTTKMALLASLFAGLVACGGEAPTTDTPDTGIDTTVDANPTVDADSGVQTPPDNGTVTPDGGVTPDAPATPDTGAAVCIPSSSNRTCSGLVCRPAPANPTCEGADACSCAMSESEMDSTICTAATMPSCNAAVTCSPGRNHCSVNLPDEVDFARFTDLDANPTRNNRGGLRNTALAEWRSTDGNYSVMFLPQPIINARSFVQVCLHLPQELMASSGADRIVACAECSGSTCYWNRGRMRNSLPSIQMRFLPDTDACGFELSLFTAGATTPMAVYEMISSSSVCAR